MADESIDQADLDSGKVVQAVGCTYWFKEPGNNMKADNSPIVENLHREGGPAAYGVGGKLYYTNGKLHRLDGPAREFTSGKNEYFVEGKEMTEAEFKALPK